jgi:hypothetical protein
MPKNKADAGSDRGLRGKAEKFLSKKPVKDGLLIDRLTHELEVHQIELKMQNEELQRSYLEIEASHQKYLELYHFAPVGYLTLDVEEFWKER